MNDNSLLPSRRQLLGALAGASLARAAGAATPRFVMQNEPHLAHARALVHAALQAAGMRVEFEDAPLGNERRNVQQISSGATHVDLMPATPERLQRVRDGRLRMIAVPLDRGLLGWRINLLLRSRRDMLARVRTVGDLAHFTLGQNVGWMDVQIYRAAGIPTKEIKQWSNGEFAEQMQAGYIDLFPLGLEETLSFFLPHFQKRYPQLTSDPHVLVYYPWFRFVWVAPGPATVALYEALQQGFARIAADGRFLDIWAQHRRLPGAAAMAGRRVIEIANPFYDQSLVPAAFRHLLARPAAR